MRGLISVNFLRRLPLSRLLLLCALVVAIGVSATALASALASGPTPPQKPLAQAVHDALSGPSVEGVTARVTLTNRLLEGANLASGSGEGITSSPLVDGGSGRLWVSKDGRLRLELQAEKGDTQVIWDGHTAEVYDAANNTLYRYTPKKQATSGGDEGQRHEVPSVAKIEEAISHLKEHVNVSDATPTNVGGQPAYTVRVSPKEGGSLIGGAELSFDAAHGLPLRAAVYSSTSSSPVVELAATEVGYGTVDSSVFAFTPPPDAKVEELKTESMSGAGHPADSGEKPTVTTHGSGITSIAVIRQKAGSGEDAAKSLEGLPKVTINGVAASELRTELGTILTFERSGVRYVLAGALGPAPIEALARGL
jgi:outer membrane lipoprotein-sorting protein